MLVRLLDAFVWRSNGMQYILCNVFKIHNNYQTSARMIWVLHTFKGWTSSPLPFSIRCPQNLRPFSAFQNLLKSRVPYMCNQLLKASIEDWRYRSFIPRVSFSSSHLFYHQLLDRCLQFVDPELFGYLRSKNLSAEIYAFPCSSPFGLRIPYGWPLIFSRLDLVRLHAAFGSSTAIMGFSFSIWRPP